jgi:hypothetical protein
MTAEFTPTPCSFCREVGCDQPTCFCSCHTRRPCPCCATTDDRHPRWCHVAFGEGA